MRYYLSDFENYISQNKLQNLPDKTLNIITQLASQVGAPEYVKTPQFKPNYTNFNRRRKKENEFIDDNDWETFRNFQTTEIVKHEGLDINLHKMRKSLNILTSKNYSKILNEIVEEFDFVMKNKTPNDVLVISNLFYEIVSTNTLYSNLSAKLFKELFDKTDNFKKILDQNVKNIELKINNIKYIDPDIDYDLFCDNNKNNEKIRGEFLFLSNLVKIDVVSIDCAINIIDILFTILNKYIEEKDKKNEIDEISEIIYIFVTNVFNTIKNFDNEKSNNIFSTIENISKMKIKTTPGISNKCIFKHMDLLDELS